VSIGESIDKALFLLDIHVLIRQKFQTRILENFENVAAERAIKYFSTV
tara:strand:- start:4546 stop:4689 length:144 start_codon:yes stop_codon:yes gene_type:complete